MADKCGAKTRSGQVCRSRAMPNGRCRMHGGTSPKTNAGHPTHGIYDQHLTPEELEISASIRLGNIDAELRMARIRVRRALAAEHNAAGQPELDSMLEREQGAEAVAARIERTYKVRDYSAIIDKLLARVESLERTRMNLRAELGIDAADMDADALTPGTPDETTPASPVR